MTSYTWTGPVLGGNWGDDANWSGLGYPGQSNPNDTATIVSGTTMTINLNVPNVVIATLNINSSSGSARSFTLSSLTNAIGVGTISLGGSGVGTLTSTISCEINSPLIVINVAPTTANSRPITISGIISGPGTLTKNGTGTLTLTGTNTYTGDTIINTGTLRIGNDDVTGSIVSSSTIINQGTLTINRSTDINFSNNIVTNTGFTCTLSAGTNSTRTQTLSGIISGNGNINKINGATIVLNNTNTYAGSTRITSGTLRIGNGGSSGSIPSSSIIDPSGGRLDINRNTDINFSNNINAGSSISSLSSFSGTQTLTGIISGSGNIAQHGNGIIILTGTNTYTGSTTIEGTLQIGNGGTTGSIMSSSLINNVGTLIINRSTDINFSNNIYAQGGNLSAGTGTQTLSGVISNDQFSTVGTITKIGAGTIILTGANTYTGNTNITEGTLVLGNGIVDGTINSAAEVNVTGTGVFAFNQATSPYTFNRPIQNPGTINIFPSKQVTISSNIIKTGTGILIKQNTGQLTLSGINNITGLTISAGELILSGANNSLTTISNSGTLQFNNNTSITNINASSTITNTGILNINRTNPLTLSCIIAGTGSLELNNTGLITLTNTNTYSGATTINNGTLSVNGSILSSTTTVNIPGTLQGTGFCGTTIVNGTLSPGNSPGLLTHTNLTLNSSSITNWELNNNTTANRGTAYDALNVTNNLTINTGATVNIVFVPNVDFTNPFWQSSQQWPYIDAATSNANNFSNLTIAPIAPGLNPPLPGTMTNIKQAEDLYINFTPSGSNIPCFAYNNIVNFTLPKDVKITKQGKYNDKWINVNGLLMTKDHLIKSDNIILYACQYTDKYDYINDELVDLISEDGRFININDLLVSTKKYDY